MGKKIVLLSLLFGLIVPSAAFADVRNSIVKIYTKSNSPDYFNPWSMLGLRGSTGSGCVISGNRILTNAHVVSDQTFIQVRKHGVPRRFKAKVLSVFHEADLALITVEDQEFFKDVIPLEIGDLPQTQQEVHVYGFPTGGDTLSTTKGVVSRIEHRNYAHSSAYILAGQIDAAINPGNSGGPVLNKDKKIVGVVMQAVNASRGENIGYMVPAPIVKFYLKDMSDGQLDGFPVLSIRYQTLENPDLRKFYGVDKSQSGVMITRVGPESPLKNIVERGDIILEIAGHQIADDGTIEFRDPERTSMLYYVQEHQLGEELELKILSKGTVKTSTVKLNLAATKALLVPNDQYEVEPSYYVYGGLVFTKLTKNLLKRWGQGWYNKAPKNLIAKMQPNAREKPGEEVVVLLKVLASNLTEGYNGYAFWVIDKIDDVEIDNLKGLATELEKASDKEFVEIVNEQGGIIVLSRKKAKEQQQEILDTYKIASPRSKDL